MKWSMMLLAAGALASAAPAGAQGIPALGAAKAAAQKAANASSSKGTAKAAAPAPATPANTAAAKPAPAVTKDTAKKGVSKDTAKKATPEVAFSREVFTYEGEGRRDPFLSLLASGDLRPAYNDLKLVAVAYDPTGRKSVAIMRDVSSNDQYRVRVGQTLGRMRVAQIHPKSVTFTIDEFGYSRQEILALGDSTQRKP